MDDISHDYGPLTMNQSLYVDIDALLDTRLGTMYRMDEELIESAIERDYKTRSSDIWSEINLDIDQDAYDELYRHRDEETLKVSRPTAVVPILTEVVEALGKASVNDPRIDSVSVDVNVWPYRLDAEVLAAIRDAVKTWVSVDCEVQIVNYEVGALTPMFIDTKYVALIVYDFNAWFDHHHDALLSKRIPTITMIAPTLYKSTSPEEEIVYEGTTVDPFAATELALVEYITLVFKDTEYYSLIGL